MSINDGKVVYIHIEVSWLTSLIDWQKCTLRSFNLHFYRPKRRYSYIYIIYIYITIRACVSREISSFHNLCPLAPGKINFMCCSLDHLMATDGCTIFGVGCHPEAPRSRSPREETDTTAPPVAVKHIVFVVPRVVIPASRFVQILFSLSSSGKLPDPYQPP